jgi:hypothetical protein
MAGSKPAALDQLGETGVSILLHFELAEQVPFLAADCLRCDGRFGVIGLWWSGCHLQHIVLLG